MKLCVRTNHPTNYHKPDKRLQHWNGRGEKVEIDLKMESQVKFEPKSDGMGANMVIDLDVSIMEKQLETMLEAVRKVKAQYAQAHEK